MGYLFVTERLAMVEPSITAIDSTLLKAKGSVWHKSSYMEKGVVLVLVLTQRCTAVGL